MSETNKSIRVRTNNSDAYIPIHLTQDFDFLNVMSLTITQDAVYSVPSANYGVLVGRISSSNGIGIPNIKVSIFIPIDEQDLVDERIKYLYPYTSTTDKNENGIRYNLLPSNKQHYYHTPVGTFPSNEELSANLELDYIYKKYYKYVATTNECGDYMIMNAPVGQQLVLIDCDISDIGELSQKPYNFTYQGYPVNMFDSQSKFKKSVSIETLPQIFSQTDVVDIKPFWGDETIPTMVGITRKDFTINYKLTPTCFFIGSMGEVRKTFDIKYTDIFGVRITTVNPIYIKQDCTISFDYNIIIEKTFQGYGQMGANLFEPSQGKIEIVRETIDGKIEVLEQNDYVVDKDGTWVLQIPMNLGFKKMDEYGNLIDDETNTGLPTYANIRLRISSETSNSGEQITTAAYLVPTIIDDYRFDVSDYTETPLKPFVGVTVTTNKIYTVKASIPNYHGIDKEKPILAISNINISGTNINNPFPYNMFIGDKPLDKGNVFKNYYGYGFTGIINGFIPFLSFEDNGGVYCDCKKNYSKMQLDFKTDSGTYGLTNLTNEQGLIKKQGEYYYYQYKNTYLESNEFKNSHTFYCGLVEIGKVHPFIDNSNTLPPATSFVSITTGVQSIHISKQCEIGIAVKNDSVYNESAITNNDIDKKQQRVLMMSLSGELTGVTMDNIENESWYVYSNLGANGNGVNPEYTKYIESPNSFYYYFGLKRGKTAIDKMVTDYILIKNNE